MQQRIPLIASTALALALAGTVHAAGEPRVMFVSKGDTQPVLIDLQGKQLPAQKGAVIPPGFTVMVPEGATVQIMTPEKGILAVRPNSLLRMDGIGGDANPYKLTLNRGGVRVANPDTNFKKFEINTPNAQVKFDKGDHETMFLMPGKLKDGRWGTFARGSKDEVLVKTKDGDLKLMPREIGHVPGGEKGKPTIITLNEGGKQLQNPVSYSPGAREIAVSQITENFQSLGDSPTTPTGEAGARSAGSTGPRSAIPSQVTDPIPGVVKYGPTNDISVAAVKGTQTIISMKLPDSVTSPPPQPAKDRLIQTVQVNGDTKLVVVTGIQAQGSSASQDQVKTIPNVVAAVSAVQKAPPPTTPIVVTPITVTRGTTTTAPIVKPTVAPVIKTTTLTTILR